MHNVGAVDHVEILMVLLLRMFVHAHIRVPPTSVLLLAEKERLEHMGAEEGVVGPLWQFRKHAVLVHLVEMYTITVFVLHPLYYRVAEEIGVINGIGAVLFAVPVIVEREVEGVIVPIGEIPGGVGTEVVRLTRNHNPALVLPIIVVPKPVVLMPTAEILHVHMIGFQVRADQLPVVSVFKTGITLLLIKILLIVKHHP